jgi:Citrate lyase, alpha subunit
MKINNRDYKPFVSAFDPAPQTGRFHGRRVAERIPHRQSKVTTLDAVMDVIRDGDTISYPHYYRTGDTGLKMVVEKLRETGKKGILIYGNAYFDHVDPWLIEAVRDGVIGGLYGNPYRTLGDHITKGEVLPWVTVGVSHGDRVRKLQTGEVRVKVAFGPVPIADRYGNANGLQGKPEELCGPIGLFAADAEFADYVCLLAGTVSERLVLPARISMELVDFVVPVACAGLNSGIGSGTLDIPKAKANPFNARVSANVTGVMKAAGVIRDGFGFQVGSGAGLVVLDDIRTILKERKIQAHFTIGGITSLHVDMLEEGTVRHLMNGQMFEPSPRVIASMLENPNHHEVSTGYYASTANKEVAVNMLDAAVLSALEVDLGFNVNTVCAGGRIIGGIGGGQDVAAGSALTIIFLPLATGKNGKGFPKVVQKVYTRTTPGEVIDVVVTEEFVAVNPAGASIYKDALLANGAAVGLKMISIEELHAKSVEAAKAFGTIPSAPQATGDIVHAIEWRDGTLLDVIRGTAAFPKN